MYSRCHSIVPTDALDESVDCLADLMLPLPPSTPTTPKSPPPELSTPPIPPPSTEEKHVETSIISPILGLEEMNRPGEIGDNCVEFSVVLKKPLGRSNCGLGLTIVGYVSEENKSKGKF